MPDDHREPACFVCGRTGGRLYRLVGSTYACRDCRTFCEASRRNARRDAPADPTAERALRQIERDEASDQAVAEVEASRHERDAPEDWRAW